MRDTQPLSSFLAASSPGDGLQKPVQKLVARFEVEAVVPFHLQHQPAKCGDKEPRARGAGAYPVVFVRGGACRAS